MRLLIISILALSFLSARAQTTDTFHGNILTFSPADTVAIQDPIQGTTTTEVVPAAPVTLNGEKIYTPRKVMSLPVYKKQKDKTEKIAELLFNTVKKELEDLEDGEYVLRIDNAVISKTGTLAYYKYSGLARLVPDRGIPVQVIKDDKTINFTRVVYAPDDQDIPVEIRDQVNTKTHTILDNMPPLSPATIDKKPVNVTGDMFHAGSVIVVKNHKAVFVPDFFAL